jgi:hypothetical protein
MKNSRSMAAPAPVIASTNLPAAVLQPDAMFVEVIEQATEIARVPAQARQVDNGEGIAAARCRAQPRVERLAEATARNLGPATPPVAAGFGTRPSR